jgi:hypothetical protein
MFGQPCTDDVQRSLSLGGVEGMPQCLAINRDDHQFFAPRVFGKKPVQPLKKACLKCGRSDFAKERANTVSAGCSSIRQIKSCVQPVCLFARPASHRLGPSASEIMAAMEIAMMFSTE